MKVIHLILAGTLAATLTACGSGNPGSASATGSSPTSSSKAPPRAGNASAEEVAEESRGHVRCPARIETKPRAAPAPVDDVLGVRPGMTYEEAANIVMCSHDLMVVQPDGRGFQIQTYGATLRQGFAARLAQPRVEKTSKQIMQEMQDSAFARGSNRVNQDMKPGDSKWYVGTIGVPGQERVINVAREEWFAEGKNPTSDSVEQALIKKYGTPTRKQPPASGTRYITWAYDPLGRQITETSPLFNRCSGVADPDGGANFSPDCGEVVVAQISGMPENPDLSRYFQVGVVDQAGGYEALTSTEHALQQLDAARKAQQVQEAAKNADAPKLKERTMETLLSPPKCVARSMRATVVIATMAAGAAILAGCSKSSTADATAVTSALDAPTVNGSASTAPASTARVVSGPRSAASPGGRGLVNPDANTVVFLYYQLAHLPLPVDNWVEEDSRVKFAPAPEKAPHREAVRAELNAAAASVQGVGSLRLTINANLSDYDPTYGEFTIRALSPSSVVNFNALGQKVEVSFINGRTAQIWRVPPAEAQAVRDKISYSSNVEIDTLLRIAGVLPGPGGGTITTEVVEYELRETQRGAVLARVKLAENQ